MNILSISHLCIVHYEDPCGYGGAALHKPTSALLNMGCAVEVVAPVPFVPFPLKYLKDKWRKYSEVPRYEIVDNVKVFHPRFISLPKSILSLFSGTFMYYGLRQLVEKVYKDFQFDLIHAHNAHPDGYAALMLSCKYRKPLIITARGTDMDIIAKRKDSFFRILKKVLTASAAVVVPSPRLASTMYQRFGIIPQIICNGIDIAEIHQAKGNLINSYKGRTVLLSVCQLISTKGIDLNIKAVKSLVSKYSNLIYIVVGDGPARRDLELLVRDLNLFNHVKFMGTLPHREAMKFMTICDIFTMPSWQETFGLVYLEAMAYGKPVIGCRGQGMDNIITAENVGLLAEPKDWHSVECALDFLLSNPERARMMGQRGRKLVLGSYTHNKNAEQTLKLYNRVLSDIEQNPTCMSMYI